jgi:hypothetical protein
VALHSGRFHHRAGTGDVSLPSSCQAQNNIYDIIYKLAEVHGNLAMSNQISFGTTKTSLATSHFLHIPTDPSLHLVPSIHIAPSRLAPVKSVFVRFTSLKFAPVRFAPLSIASLKFAPISHASASLALVRFALLKFDFWRLAVDRFAPVRFALDRFASRRFAFERFARIRFALKRLELALLIEARYAPDRSQFGQLSVVITRSTSDRSNAYELPIASANMAQIMKIVFFQDTSIPL